MTDNHACLFIAHGLDTLRSGLPSKYHQWKPEKIERFPGGGLRQYHSTRPDFGRILDAAGYQGQLPSWKPWQAILKNNSFYKKLVTGQENQVVEGHWLHPMELLKQLLLSYISCVTALEYHSQVAYSVASNFISSLENGKSDIDLIIPVFGVTTSCPEVHFDDGIKLVVLTDENAADLCVEFPIPGFNVDFPAALVVLSRGKAYSLQTPPSDMIEFQGIAGKILTALRLQTDTDVTMGGCYQWQQKKGQLHFGIGRPGYLHPPDSLRRPNDSYLLHGQFLNEVITRFKALSAQNLPKRFRSALLRYNMAYDRQKSEDELVDLVISLEAIYGDNAGAHSYKIALRSAVFIGNDRSERGDIFSLVEKGYKVRNSLVHGADSIANNNNRKIRNIVRRSIVSVLDVLAKDGKILTSDQFDSLLLD